MLLLALASSANHLSGYLENLAVVNHNTRKSISLCGDCMCTLGGNDPHSIIAFTVSCVSTSLNMMHFNPLRAKFIIRAEQPVTK